MDLNISTKNFKPTKYQKLQLFNKLKGVSKQLTRFMPENTVGDIRIVKDPRWGYKIRFNLPLPKKKRIFAEAKGKNFINSVDQLKDIISRQIADHKEKITESYKKD